MRIHADPDPQPWFSELHILYNIYFRYGALVVAVYEGE